MELWILELLFNFPSQYLHTEVNAILAAKSTPPQKKNKPLFIKYNYQILDVSLTFNLLTNL